MGLVQQCTRYIKLQVAHAPGMPGMFPSPPTSKEPLVKDPGMHHGTCVTPSRGIANPPWRGKHSRHSRRKRNPQFYVSGKRPMGNRTDRRAHQAQAVVAAAVAAVLAVVVVVSLLLLLLLFTVSALSSFVKIFQVYLYHSVLLNWHCVNHMIIPVTE